MILVLPEKKNARIAFKNMKIKIIKEGLFPPDIINHFTVQKLKQHTSGADNDHWDKYEYKFICDCSMR